MYLNLQQIISAQTRIGKLIKETPLGYSPFYSKVTNSQVYLKLENLQLTGAFKIRGALNKLFNLNEEEIANGVVAASAGNHAQGIAYGAKLLGIKATIIVPENTPLIRLKAIKEYGIDLRVFGRNYDEAERKARELENTTGMTYISGYNDYDVIAGQGTIGLEILKDKSNVDTIIVPVGGGGLISGIAIAAKSTNPEIRVIGVQSIASPVMYKSIKAGRIMEMELEDSIAEGLQGGIEKDSVTFNLVKKYVDEILLVSESEIRRAIKLLYEHHNKQIAEGAGAVGLAALMRYKEQFKNHKNAVVVSGGNIDSSLLEKILNEQK